MKKNLEERRIAAQEDTNHDKHEHDTNPRKYSQRFFNLRNIRVCPFVSVRDNVRSFRFQPIKKYFLKFCGM